MPTDPREHLRRFRQRIDRHRFINWTTSVHTRVDIDVTAADAYLVDSGLDRADPPVTREHLWLCAAARVLRERPLFNVRYDGLRRIEPQADIHLRVSIAQHGQLAWGLIEHADRLPPAEMARAHRALGAKPQPSEAVAQPMVSHRGRLGRLLDDALDTLVDLAPFLERRLGRDAGHEAGTFTVLNAGLFGAEDLHVVVLRPAIAQLVVMRPREVIEPAEDGSPRVLIKVPMSAPFCHKLMDTDAAGYFLHHMQVLLDDPARHLAGAAEASP